METNNQCIGAGTNGNAFTEGHLKKCVYCQGRYDALKALQNNCIEYYTKLPRAAYTPLKIHYMFENVIKTRLGLDLDNHDRLYNCNEIKG